MKVHRHHRGRVGLGITVAAALLLTACGGGTAPAPTSPPAAAPTAAPAAKPTAAPTTAPTAAAKPAAAATTAPAAAAGGTTPSLPPPEQKSIKVGNAAHEADSFAPEFAKSLGLYKKYGFDNVDTFYFDGDAKARQALLAGQVDAMSGGPGSSLGSLITDTPFEAVGTFILHPTDDLISVASVKNVEDLKGKQIAVSSFGGDSHASVLLSLKALGVNPDDVTLVPIGGQSARIAALVAGSVAAAPIDDTLEDQMKGQGLNVLLRLPDAPVTLARESLQVRKDFAEKNPNTVLAIVAASMEAEQAIFTQTDKAIDAFMEWTQETDRSKATKEIEDYKKVANRDLRFAPDGWDNLKEVMVSANADLKDVDPKQAYTYEFLDKLHAMGFDKAVGVPGT